MKMTIINNFSKSAGIAFCYGKGKRAVASPIIFSLYREEFLPASGRAAFCFSFKKGKRNKTIIFNGRLLAGYRNTDGSFNNRGTNANLWSSLESGTNAWNRNLNSAEARVNRNTNNKLNGFSVRCLKDRLTIDLLQNKDYCQNFIP